MSLRQYKSMRRFRDTPEPSGGRSNGDARIFVVQLHHASHRHYDFRLELDGVLKSWAVPKGPSFDPAVSRLAMQVEDHPIDYATFEGIIPKGNYGAGDVLIFDHGTWTSDDDIHRQLKKGHLRFVMSGDKLRGAWDLVRTGVDRGKPRWLLRKAADDEAGPFESDDLLGDPDEQRKPTAVWISNRGARGATVSSETVTTKKSKPTTKADPAEAMPTLSSGERVVFPEQGLTKAGVFEYYRAVGPFMVPEISNRPLALLRCPGGTGATCFFQKHLSPGFGPQVHGTQRGSEKSDAHVWVNGLPGLLGLAQMNAIEIHAWGGHVDDIDHADRIVIDLDPADDVPWTKVVSAAELVRDTLKTAGLVSFARVTGGKGIHIVAPIAPVSWDSAKSFTHDLATALMTTRPEEFLDVMTKNKRGGKIFVDYLRNGRGATAVASYSLRNKPGATVAMPVTWAELKKLPSASTFDLRSALKYLARRKKDPWAGIDTIEQSLPALKK